MNDSNYIYDHRVIAGGRNRPRFDEARMTITLVLEDDDGEPVEHAMPACFAVCSTCNGKGRHVNPAVDAGGITDWSDWDGDEREAYFSGAYDVDCYECRGKRVVAEIDESLLSAEQASVLEEANEQAAEDAAFEAMSRAERSMGA